MDDSDGVRRLKRPADLADDADGLLLGVAAMFQDHEMEVAAVDVLHGDELHPVGLAEVEDADDVLVGDLGCEQQLLLEALDDVAVAGELGPNDFEGDKAADLYIAGLVDSAHASGAK